MSDATIYKATVNDGVLDMRAVIFWDETAYCAICVERDIASQGKTPKEALERLRIVAQMDRDLEDHMAANGELRAPIGPSPQEFAAKWESATVAF